jgi:ligand-binding sensor domain-containing protein
LGDGILPPAFLPIFGIGKTEIFLPMELKQSSSLWVGSKYGLQKFAAGNNSTFTLYDTGNSPLPGPYILDVEADPSGGIRIGTSAGLVRFDGTNWMIYNQANTGMPGRIVYDVARRPSDSLIAIANKQPETFPYLHRRR